MYILQSEIIIANYRFSQVIQVKIEESWRTIGDTAMIKLPRLTKQLDKFITVGDSVSIKIGYKDVLFEEEFVGFVSSISPDYPYTVDCEDYLYHAKRTNLKKLFKQTTLAEIINYVVTEINSQRDVEITAASGIPEISLEKYRINNISAAKVLQNLKEEKILSIYFKGTKLFVGKPITELSAAGDEVKYSTSWNIIKSNLKLVAIDDRKYVVKAIAIQKDNTHLEQEVGDIDSPDGELQTVYFPKITDQDKLKELAEAKLSVLKYSGFEGNFSTFFVPNAQHSMVASIEDEAYNNGRAGSYLIDSVSKEFGINGARRKIELGIQL